MGSHKFFTALLQLFHEHGDQDAVVFNIVQGLSDSRKIFKYPDTTSDLNVPNMPLEKLAKLLAGVLETRSAIIEHNLPRHSLYPAVSIQELK